MQEAASGIHGHTTAVLVIATLVRYPKYTLAPTARHVEICEFNTTVLEAAYL